MLAAEHYPDVFADAVLPKPELLEIHRSKISIHNAKAEYSYPTIRLPPTFSQLAGLRTRIYQTVHDGALTFLVVVSSTSKRSPDKPKTAAQAPNPRLHTSELVLFDHESPCLINGVLYQEEVKGAPALTISVPVG